MALATLHLAAIPVFAGLLAGSGAVATYVAAPSSPVVVSAAASPVLANPAQQTGLPRCQRSVRMVASGMVAKLIKVGVGL